MATTSAAGPLEHYQRRVDHLKLLGGLLLLLGATAVILMGTVGAARAQRAHPDAMVSGVVIANGFTADCATTDGLGAVSDGSCDAAAARITASSDVARFPIGSTRTIFGPPADLQIGRLTRTRCPPARYRTSWRLSASSLGHRWVLQVSCSLVLAWRHC